MDDPERLTHNLLPTTATKDGLLGAYMELLGYFFATYGILGLMNSGSMLLGWRKMKNSVSQPFGEDMRRQYKGAAFAPLIRHSGALVLVSLIALSIGVYILVAGISNARPDQGLNQFWKLIGIYALGVGVTVEAAYRCSTATGRLVSTELEWHFNGLFLFLYLALSAWIFFSFIDIVPWWALLPLELFAGQIGVLVAEKLQRLMGGLRGFVFLISPISLIWSALILWSLN